MNNLNNSTLFGCIKISQHLLILGSGCDKTRDCDENAICELGWDGNEEKYMCNCFSGYSGDGRTCTKNPTEVWVYYRP